MKNHISKSLPGYVSALLIALFAVVLMGCSTTKKVDWSSRVGTYTYDQAVTELGPPDKQSKLSDGKTVADWISRSSSGASIGFGMGSYNRHSATGVGVSTPVGNSYSDRVLRLTFGTDNKLIDWYKNY